MISNFLGLILFVSVVMWPVALPLFLILLAGAVWLFVYIIKNWKRKSSRVIAGVVGCCILLLVLALWRERQPYSEGAARRLYESHREAYDAVAGALWVEGGSYWQSDREIWPEKVAVEMEEVLELWSLRTGSPRVYAEGSRTGGIEAVRFCIYDGPEYDSGDGCWWSDSQYLVYIPDKSGQAGSKSMIHLTGDWYLDYQVGY